MAASDRPTSRSVANKVAYALRAKRTPAAFKGYDTEKVGHVVVEMKTEEGYAFNRSVKMKHVTQLSPGAPVLVGLDSYRDLAVVDSDFDAQVEAGINPLGDNAADRTIYGSTNQDSIMTLQIYAIGTAETPSTEVVVKPWFYLFDGTWYLLREQRQELDSFIPGTGEHCLACLWVDLETATIEITSSTPKNLVEILDTVDVQECYDALTATYAAPGRAFRLYGGQTEVIESDSWRDLRQILNVESLGGGGGAPADATYITQTPSAGLSAEQAMSTLGTGLVMNTTATGVQSIAVAGTDYAVPDDTSLYIGACW